MDISDDGRNGHKNTESGTLHNHPVRNILLSALIDTKGSLTEASRFMCRILNVKGTVLPLTEERVELIGEGDGKNYVGEEAVSANIRQIRRLRYDRDFRIPPEIAQRVSRADLVVFSPGSLYTSILPHLIAPEVLRALASTGAPLMYVSNLVTQPGETDGYDVSSHVRVLNRYLEESRRKIDVVVANNEEIDPRIIEKYLQTENKRVARLDRAEVESLGVRIIEGDIFSIEDERVRHNALKTAYLIFSYLMEES